MEIAFTFIFVAGGIVPTPVGGKASDACLPAGTSLDLGWCRYKAGEFREAAVVFEKRLASVPGDLDAAVGAAYSRMQLGEVAAARSLFRSVLERRPEHGDAIAGLKLSALRAPAEELRVRPDADPARPLGVPARALRDYIEVREPSGAYAPVFVKGVNLGAALPGKYPTEFPREAPVYAQWLQTIADLGANTVRVYTLLPPEFYRSLVAHNASPGARRLFLIQGVWAELPPDNDFTDPAYVTRFSGDIARVIDAVHGDLVLPERPGSASGIFDADASDSVLAYIIGREWEPYAVKAFDARHADDEPFSGRYLRVQSGSAMESWVARMCDFAAGYEERRYRVLRPLTFANWPTLDPLRHETESDRAEEDAWKAKYGIPYPDALKDEPWDNDAVSLDPARISPTSEMPAGFFAAYHIYPNYPDFMNLEPGPATGTTRYAAYLAALKRHHGSQPVIVAEFGISTSRGIAHVQPEGWHHGGHDERGQGALIAQMVRSIREQGYAGGILFELMDEWFKGTWSTTPLEIPQERRRLWFNAESPEESYGVIANRPASPVRLDGDPSDWRGAPYVRAARGRGRRGWDALREIRVTADEGYVYFLLRTGGGPGAPDWGTVAYRLAVDTYDRARGETALPEPGAATIATGAEFLITLTGPESSTVAVTAPYEPFAFIEHGPVASPRGGAGRFVPLAFATNRERIGRDGTRYPAIVLDRGALRFGSLDPKAGDFDTRADVAVGAATGTIELRVPWSLLNVTDPSSRRVLHQEAVHEPPLDTVETRGFRIYAFALDPSRPGDPPRSRVPGSGEAPVFSWAGWEAPRFRSEPKAGIPTIREALDAIPDRVAPPGGRDAR